MTTHITSFRALILAFFLWHCSFVYSQPILRFKNIAGLSDNNVNIILEDSKGYIWVGTRNGLNRFNGTEYEVSEPIDANSNSITHPLILDLIEIGEQNIWGSTEGGISMFLSVRSRRKQNQLQKNYFKKG